MRGQLPSAALAVILAACGGTDPVNDPPLVAEVQARFEAWVTAWNARQPAGLEPFYLHKPHLTVAWPNGERTRGWDEEAALQRRLLPTVSVMNLDPQAPTIVLVRRDLALVTFAFSLDMLAGGTRQIGPGQGMMLWQKEGRAWVIWAAQMSLTRAIEARITGPARFVLPAGLKVVGWEGVKNPYLKAAMRTIADALGAAEVPNLEEMQRVARMIGKYA